MILQDLHDSSPEGKKTLFEAMRVCTEMKALIRPICYKSLDDKAHLVKERKHQKIELLARSLLRNPILRSCPKEVNFDMTFQDPGRGRTLSTCSLKRTGISMI